jgi:hypothetical protein
MAKWLNFSNNQTTGPSCHYHRSSSGTFHHFVANTVPIKGKIRLKRDYGQWFSTKHAMGCCGMQIAGIRMRKPDRNRLQAKGQMCRVLVR